MIVSTEGYFDFHLHSHASDGEFPPTDLLHLLHTHGVTMAALTDHDTMDGVEEAQVASEKYGLNLLPGIEITVMDGTKEVHILGLGLKKVHKKDAFLQMIQEARLNRLDEVLALFRKTGMDISIKDLPPTSSPGRLHIAKALVEKGFSSSISSAFRRWLQKGRRYFRRPQGCSLKAALSWIRDQGGSAILAHPQSLNFSESRLREWLGTAVPLGLDGLEILHSGFPVNKIVPYFKLAGEFKIGVTGGSDFHSLRSLQRPGRGAGGMVLENEKLSGYFYKNL